MILIEGQKIYCKGCGKIIENIYDSCILLNIEANEKSPLYCLNEAIFHRDCYNNYPLRNMYEKRVAELEKLSSLNNFDYISKEELSLEKIGHPDNLIRVPFLTEDYNSPLYEYNCISLNKKNLDKWRNYKIFLKLIDNLNKSDEWRGKALSFLMSQLNSPVKPDILRQFFITDHLGTPIEAYNQEGELIWEREQDLYGNSRQGFAKKNFRCPFKYQGQYYDPEIELCYNRFRYYHPETGRYISQDPIGFLSGEANFFAYVSDTNAWVDVLGLGGSIYANTREMTDEEIARFFGDEEWHDTNAKKDYLGNFKKEMKGDTNADFHIDKDTNDIYLKTNKKEIWINTGDKLE